MVLLVVVLTGVVIEEVPVFDLARVTTAVNYLIITRPFYPFNLCNPRTRHRFLWVQLLHRIRL